MQNNLLQERQKNLGVFDKCLENYIKNNSIHQCFVFPLLKGFFPLLLWFSGIPSLAGQDLSFVTVEFLDTAPKGQSSHHVSVLEDGSFFVSSEWSLETPGEYEISESTRKNFFIINMNHIYYFVVKPSPSLISLVTSCVDVSVSNLLSTLSSTLRLSVSQPAHGLVISMLPGPLGVPSSCVHPQQATSKSAATQPVFLGDPVTLQAHVGEGLATGFCWCFDREKREDRKEMEEERKCVKTTCFPNSDCLNSTLVCRIKKYYYILNQW